MLDTYYYRAGLRGGKRRKKEEDEVEQVVRDEGALFFLSYTIGGKSLSHSEVHITRVQKTGTVEEDSAYCPDVYLVSGKIYAVDIYGDKYENSFDCSVNWSSGEWISNGIETKSKNWDKSGS